MNDDLTPSPLDAHFAALMVKLHGIADADLERAAAAVSAHRAAGHICMPLAELGGERLAEKLRATRVVGAPGEFKPLILDASGRVASWRKYGDSGITPSRRCSVVASVGKCPRSSANAGSLSTAFWIDSFIRAAAFPVGAASATRGVVPRAANCPCKSASTAATVRVLPVPGPPVMTQKPRRTAVSAARRCQSGFSRDAWKTRCKSAASRRASHSGVTASRAWIAAARSCSYCQ